MKIQLFAFSRDLRSDELKKRYEIIEQKRADAYLSMHLDRLQAEHYRNVELPALMRRQAG